MVIQGQTTLLPVFPVDIFVAFPVNFHGNAIIYRANQFAKITTDAFFVDHGVGIVRFPVFKPDRLVRSILASDIAKSAMNAFILVNVCDNLIVDIEIFPVRHRWN